MRGCTDPDGSAPRPGAVSAALADGLTRVWLAGHQEGTAAARPAAAGEQLYTVNETVQGPSDSSMWCTAHDSLCLNSFSLFGITGNGADQGYLPTGVTCTSSTIACTSYQVTYSVPVGTYMGSGFAIFKQDSVLQVLDLTDPQVTVAGDTSVTLDANAAHKITISTPRPSFSVAAATEDYRLTPDGTLDANLDFVGYGSQNLWVAASQPVTVGAFDFSSSWILYSPTLSMNVVAPNQLALQPEYPSYAPFDGSFTLFPAGSQTLPVVNAGIGSAQDFSGIDARGKLALIQLDPAVGGCMVESSQLQNALQAGAAGVLVDPTLPPSVGTCYLPVIPQSFVGLGPVVNIPFASLPAAQATALEGLLAHGTARIHIAALANSPYQYDLKFYAEGQLPSSTAYQVTDRTLTAVSTRYHQAQAAMVEPNDIAFAPDEFFVGGVGDFLSAPAAQTEYYGPTSPAVAWNGVPDLEVGGNLIAAPQTWDVFGQHGGHMTEDWFDSPATLDSVALPDDVLQAQPGKYDNAEAELAGCAGCRQGDVFYPFFYQVSGADPRLLDGPYFFAPGDIHLYQGGQEIQPISVDGTAAYQLPPAKASYQLDTSDNNTTTDWQFTSEEPASNQVAPGLGCGGSFFSGSTAPCAPDPLIFLRYNAFTTLANAVTAGATHQIQVTPTYQASAQPAQITSLKLWISADGGSTWQQEPVQDHDGSYTASYNVPAPSATSGTVSVKVQAGDSAGDTVSQTIDDAYTITN